MISLGKKALEAKDFLASVTEEQKNKALILKTAKTLGLAKDLLTD